jgi:hypothetical protein
MKLTDCDLTRPFTHPGFIGAFCIIDGRFWIHRDNPEDFKDEAFIREHCSPVKRHIDDLTAFDLLRTDWYNVD